MGMSMTKSQTGNPLSSEPLAPMPRPRGIVLFVHGRGSRGSRSRYATVLDVLHGYGFVTVRLDLGARSPAGRPVLGADAGGWSDRVRETLDSLREAEGCGGARVGVIAFDDAAAPALLSAADGALRAAALVCCHGQFGPVIGKVATVQAPTMLIVGGQDAADVEMHRRVMQRLRCTKRIETIPGTGASFDAPGAIETVAHLAGTWFEMHLAEVRRY